MAIRVGIIADDLTGAGDTAVQFVRAGWPTELQLRPVPSSSTVIAVTTDSRNHAALDAAALVAAEVKRLADIGATHLYKKIDSTLRGQVRAELEAALDSWTRSAVAVVCPALPGAGRTVRHGELQVNGVPVAQTAAGNDPVTPVTESHIPTLLGASNAGSIAAGSSEDAASLADRIRSSGRIVVVDAATEDDLSRIAEAVRLLGPDAIAVGSAGLARHLASIWREPAAPAIVIVTSLQDAARCQAAAVQASGAYRFEPQPDDLLDERAWGRVSAQIVDQLDEMNSTLLLTAPSDRTRRLPATLIPSRFAELTARIIGHRPRGTISGIVVTGGDGARALVDALNASSISLRDEVLPGVPIGILVGGPANGLTVATKAGGFGDVDALVKAVDSVRFRRFV
jgi:uncharacterized protein YgbK (DUF1537 family)